MKGMITRIEVQEGRKGRYHLYIQGLDTPLSIHEDVLVRLGLSKGMDIDLAGIEEILDLEEQTKVKQAALHYLSYRPRTEQELDRYLERAGFEKRHREVVIAELSNLGYIDDRQFAVQWIRSRREIKGYGSLRLRQELQQKGIASEIIEELLQATDGEKEFQLALSVAEGRYQRLQDLPWKTIERRLGHYLARRGFPHGLIFMVLDRIRIRRDEEQEG